jgi:hypothetical protein
MAAGLLWECAPTVTPSLNRIPTSTANRAGWRAAGINLREPDKDWEIAAKGILIVIQIITIAIACFDLLFAMYVPPCVP